MSNIIQATDASFEQEVLNSQIPVLVDFWAPWCGPCRMLAPTLELIAKEYEGKLKIVKVNVDENHATATTYGVLGIPFLLIFKEGRIVATESGNKSKSHLTAFIDSSI